MEHVRGGRSAEGYPNSYVTWADMDALRSYYRPPDVSRIAKLPCAGPESKPLLSTLVAELRQNGNKIREQLREYSDALHKLDGSTP